MAVAIIMLTRQVFSALKLLRKWPLFRSLFRPENRSQAAVLFVEGASR
jgi:hypothetical protein